MSKSYPLYGFGGTPKNDQKLIKEDQYSFVVNRNQANPLVYGGIDSVLAIYKESISQIELGDSPYLAPILEKFYKHIHKMRRGFSLYTILVIMIRNPIKDMEQTKELVVKLSHEACSIILFADGDEDFSQMEDLDEDDELLKDKNGNECAHHMLQFIKIRGL